MSSNLTDWLFRRPSLDDLAEEAERAIADASVRRYTWARDEARRELLRVLRTSAAQRVRENMYAEARGLPHEHIPLAIAADILRHDPFLPTYEDEPGVDSSPEPLWEAEHGPDTASSPYRSPAPMPRERSVVVQHPRLRLALSRIASVALVAAVFAVGFVLIHLAARLIMVGFGP